MTKHRTLRDALIGETVTVGKLAGEGPVRRRIMDMGVTKGTQIFIRKVAPLGDPIEVTVRATNSPSANRKPRTSISIDSALITARFLT